MTPTKQQRTEADPPRRVTIDEKPHVIEPRSPVQGLNREKGTGGGKGKGGGKGALRTRPFRRGNKGKKGGGKGAGKETPMKGPPKEGRSPTPPRS